MISPEIIALVGILGAAISIATFFVGRSSASAKNGERWGRVETKLEQVATGNTHTREAVQVLRSETAASIKRIEDKLDAHTHNFQEHLRADHGINGIKMPPR